MTFFGIRRGLDIAQPGAPVQALRPAPPVRQVALHSADYPGLRAEMLVDPDETVARGQPVFRDRKRPAIQITSPVSGTVASIEIGARHRLASVAIDIAGHRAARFDIPATPTRDGMQALCLQSGLWAAFLRRPFGRIPDPGTVPDAIFVTAMHSDPLSPDASVVLAEEADVFAVGLSALKLLTDGPVFVCQGPGPDCAAGDDQIRIERFAGPHPAGLPGTHIDRLFAPRADQSVWQIAMQEVAALGTLMRTGERPGGRIVALAGPGVRNPGLVRVPEGAALDDLLRGELTDGQKRVLSGSPLSGRESAHLRRHHWQVSVLDRPTATRPLPGWLPRHGPETRPLPAIPTAALTRSLGPDLPVIPLLRALSVGDADTAERLGARGLLEEDLALAAYAAGGQDFPAMLRHVLDELEARG